MRRLILVAGGLALLAGLWLWGMGGAGWLAAQAAQGQHGVQNAMAGALRRLQGGQPGALAALWTLCFAYGFLHAAGPGHGKLVIGAYGLGRRVPLVRLSVLAVASSLAQALTAVVLVGAGVAVFGWQRAQMQGLADRTLAQISAVLIGMIGLWLLWRGLRGVWRLLPVAAAPVVARAAGVSQPLDMGLHRQDLNGLGLNGLGLNGLGLNGLGLNGLGQPMPPVHGPDEMCATCDHAHGPTLAQAQEVRSLRDGLAVVGAVAVRPCTGALFLLILTWQLGIFWAGVAGALIMGLGTASVTLVVAVAAVSLRESALMQAATGRPVARATALAESLAGALILAVAAQMLVQLTGPGV